MITNPRIRFGGVLLAYIVVGVGNSALGCQFSPHDWRFWGVLAVAGATVVTSKLSPGSIAAQEAGKDAASPSQGAK